MKKLTAIERQFATDNHNLIYHYLHDKDLSIEDYYGAAADGLILATMAYKRKPELHDNYAFSTIAYKYMKCETITSWNVSRQPNANRTNYL